MVPKVEGPYLIQDFTDDTQAVAIVADTNGLTWKKGTADLSLWELSNTRGIAGDSVAARLSVGASNRNLYEEKPRRQP